MTGLGGGNERDETTAAIAREDGTFNATVTTTGEPIHFLDRVYDGETVEVYRSVEDAEAERGGFRNMRVVWTEDDWMLEPVE